MVSQCDCPGDQEASNTWMFRRTFKPNHMQITTRAQLYLPCRKSPSHTFPYTCAKSKLCNSENTPQCFYFWPHWSICLTAFLPCKDRIGNIQFAGRKQCTFRGGNTLKNNHFATSLFSFCISNLGIMQNNFSIFLGFSAFSNYFQVLLCFLFFFLNLKSCVKWNIK